MHNEQYAFDKRIVVRRKKKAVLVVICSVIIFTSVYILIHKMANKANSETKNVSVVHNHGQATNKKDSSMVQDDKNTKIKEEFHFSSKRAYNNKMPISATTEEHSKELEKRRRNLINISENKLIQRAELGIPDAAPVFNSGCIRGNNSLAAIARANPNSIFVNGANKSKIVALTFDDAPDSKDTPKLLDILKDQGVKATFFLIGKKINGCENIVERAYDEGHLIAGHTYTHPALTKISSQQVESELTGVDDKIYSVIGRRIVFIRPPYGDINQSVDNTYNRLNYKAVLWSIDTLDWQNHDKNKIINTVMAKASTDDIILCHMDGTDGATLEAVPELIKNLKDKGYSFERVDQLLDIKGYK